jgi:hypothetical protein
VRGETQLFKVVRTFRVGGRFPHALNRRKEHSDQNGDYRDDYEHFDERKAGAIVRHPLYTWLRFYASRF